MFFEYSQLLPKFSQPVQKGIRLQALLGESEYIDISTPSFFENFFPKTTFSNLTIPMTSQLHFTPILPQHPLLNWPCFANYISFFLFYFFPLETPPFLLFFFRTYRIRRIDPEFSLLFGIDQYRVELRM